MKRVSHKICRELRQYEWRDGALLRPEDNVTFSEIRKLLRNGLVEVVPGMYVSPEMVGPNQTVIMERRVWEKMVEMAERLAPSVSTEQQRAGDAGSVVELR